MVVDGQERPGSPLQEAPMPEGGLRRVIVWFRRDLRLADNPALVAALRLAPEVVSGPWQLMCCLRSWQACSSSRFATMQPRTVSDNCCSTRVSRLSCPRRRRSLPGGAPTCSCPALPALQLPVYIWVPEEEGQFQPGRCSRWWLAASLQALDADLRVRP